MKGEGGIERMKGEGGIERMKGKGGRERENEGREIMKGE